MKKEQFYDLLGSPISLEIGGRREWKNHRVRTPASRGATEAISSYSFPSQIAEFLIGHFECFERAIKRLCFVRVHLDDKHDFLLRGLVVVCTNYHYSITKKPCQ